VGFVRFVSHYHGEPPDHVVPAHDSINDTQNDTPKPPIKIVPKVTHVDSKCYHNMFIKPSVSNHVDEIGKQWKHWKSWNHMKPLLFYLGDPGDLFNPVEERGERLKIIVGCNKFNI
jgi:hypothetical protein